MSKVNSFAYGEISGKFGNTVGAVDKKGRTTMKTFRAPTNPQTESQMAQRARFGFVNTEVSTMKLMFRNTFVSYTDKEDLNKASWKAVNSAVTGTAPNLSLDYTQLIVAKGSLPKLGKLTVTVEANATVNVTWDTTVFLGVDQSDNVKVLFADPEAKLWLLSDEETLRSQGSMSIQVPDTWTGTKVHCWVFTMTANKKATSNSQYISLLQL